MMAACLELVARRFSVTRSHVPLSCSFLIGFSSSSSSCWCYLRYPFLPLPKALCHCFPTLCRFSCFHGSLMVCPFCTRRRPVLWGPFWLEGGETEGVFLLEDRGKPIQSLSGLSQRSPLSGSLSLSLIQSFNTFHFFKLRIFNARGIVVMFNGRRRSSSMAHREKKKKTTEKKGKKGKKGTVPLDARGAIYI